MELQNWYICEDYPHPINEMRFGSEYSAIKHAVQYYNLPSEDFILSNGMGFCFIQDGELKGFRVLLEKQYNDNKTKRNN